MRGASASALRDSGRRTQSESELEFSSSSWLPAPSAKTVGSPEGEKIRSDPTAWSWMPTSRSCRSWEGGMTRRISSKPTLREEVGDSINWDWTKTSKVSVRPGTVASGGHSSATMLEATGVDEFDVYGVDRCGDIAVCGLHLDLDLHELAQPRRSDAISRLLIGSAPGAPAPGGHKRCIDRPLVATEQTVPGIKSDFGAGFVEVADGFAQQIAGPGANFEVGAGGTSLS